MVKGTSRQVIMVHSPETELFEQAIFILKEDAIGEGISDETLLKEAQKAIHGTKPLERRKHNLVFCLLWTGLGVALTSITWLLTTVFF